VDDVTLLLYGYSRGRRDWNPKTDLAADAFDLALDRSGAKDIGFYSQKIGREWVLMIDVTDASIEDRELICKELGMVNPDLITYDPLH
jgi:hypothetical protein